MQRHFFSSATLLFALIICLSAAVPVPAHLTGGVSQRTVISELSDAVLIEYNTFFGPETVFTQYPDQDFNGALDGAERAGFLERGQTMLSMFLAKPVP